MNHGLCPAATPARQQRPSRCRPPISPTARPRRLAPSCLSRTACSPARDLPPTVPLFHSSARGTRSERNEHLPHSSPSIQQPAEVRGVQRNTSVIGQGPHLFDHEMGHRAKLHREQPCQRRRRGSSTAGYTGYAPGPIPICPELSAEPRMRPDSSSRASYSSLDVAPTARRACASDAVRVPDAHCLPRPSAQRPEKAVQRDCVARPPTLPTSRVSGGNAKNGNGG